MLLTNQNKETLFKNYNQRIVHKKNKSIDTLKASLSISAQIIKGKIEPRKLIFRRFVR